MTRSIRLGALLTGALLAGPAAALHAQGAPAAPAAPAGPACALDFTSPAQLELARGQVARAEQAANAADRLKAMKDALRFVGDKKVDPALPTRAYLLGYIASLNVPAVGAPPMVDFGALGWPGAAPGTMLDPIAVMDSLYSYVASQLPGCKGQMDGARQNAAWVDRVKAAYRTLQENKADSAKALAEQSLRFWKGAPFAYEVLAGVANQKDDKAAEIAAYEQILALVPATDTAFTDLRRRSLWSRASIYSDWSDAEPDAAKKKELGLKAIEGFIEIITQIPDYELTPYAVANGGAATALAQDTVNARRIIKPLVDAPDKYTDLSLEKGAALATEIGDRKDGITLYKAHIAKNPFNPLSLYNLGVLYYQEKQAREIFPVAEALLKIDTSNPSAVDLYSFAYQLLGDAEKTPARKKLMADSSAAWGAKSRAITSRVSIAGLSRLPRRAQAQGEVENLGTTPKTHTLTVEFLDAKGAVIESVTKEIGTVAPKKSVAWNVAVEKPGVAGLRYTLK